MRRLLYLALLVAGACTSSSYPNIDRPSTGGSGEDRSIIAYIDQRLEEEYYWLDEVIERGGSFDRGVKWGNYLAASLGRLETNSDDGYINSKGQRVLYSYIREYKSSTRSATTGFGIDLHYTIAIIDEDNEYFGFLVDHVYAESPANQAGIKRGDIITMIDGGYITYDNYNTLFNRIQNNTASTLKLTLRSQTTSESYTAELTKGGYDESPVAHYEVINIDDKSIGYIVYTGFEMEYDDALLAAIRDLKSGGAEDIILDLRINGGGSVNSATKLCSALMPSTLEDATLCSIERNPKNKKSEQVSYFKLKDTGSIFELDSLTVICSGYSASASELVVMGLRGLDVPVTLIGSTTEGKNCGMDVTRRTVDGINVEFAPITFMCFNAKGFGGWGEGITPDIDLTAEDNTLGVHDANYPLPRADWGDYNHDIALAAALSHVTGKSISQSTRSHMIEELPIAARIEPPMEGIRVYVEE